MTKLFASDFDGTLFFHDRPGQLVSQADLDAIAAFRAQGGLFGACTGRPLLGLTTQSDGHIDFDFYITTTGAALFDGERKLLWSKTIDREVLREMYDHYDRQLDEGEYQVLACGDNYWTIGQTPTQFDIPIASSFDELPGPFYGFSIETVTIEAAAAYAVDLNERYAGVAVAHQNLNSIDVVPAGCTKGTGLRWMAEHYGADLVAGIGDSLNDLPLLEAADVSYTFASSEEGVRATADILVESAAEAIYDFMER